MNRNEEITKLSAEILTDITNNSLPLHSILLKAARLSSLLDMPTSVELFVGWAKDAEHNSFVVDTFQINMQAAADPSVSLSSSNEYQHVSAPNNSAERNFLRGRVTTVVSASASYRTQAYKFALNIYSKWQFGNVAQSIFEEKRLSVEPTLNKIFPDAQQRLNSIDQNLRSENPEDWKNAASSCRALLMDLADILNPPKKSEDKERYINRLQDFIGPRVESKTRKKLLTDTLDELKKRVENTVKLTQGPAHKSRPFKTDAQDVVLYTYLAIAELLSIYSKKVQEETESLEK